MKILNTIILLFAALFGVASIYGFEFGLPLLLACFGLKECASAKDYYDKKQKKMAVAAVIVGIFSCVCAFLSITNII